MGSPFNNYGLFHRRGPGRQNDVDPELIRLLRREGAPGNGAGGFSRRDATALADSQDETQRRWRILKTRRPDGCSSLNCDLRDDRRHTLYRILKLSHHRFDSRTVRSEAPRRQNELGL
jgi:hypothetical protein